MAQDGGVPHVGCAKACCTSGLAFDPASLAIRDTATGATLLLEATPAIERQLRLLPARPGRNPVDAVLLTHAHIGHYLGLAHFGREVANTQGLPVYASPRFAAFLRQNGPWSQLVALGQIEVREFTPGVTFAPLPGLEVTAIPVPHRDEFSDTMAFRVRGPERTLLFVPDLDAWDRVPQLLDGADLAFVDGTFWDGSELPGRDLREIPHPPVVETMRRFAGRPGIRFIHLNHTNPLLRDPRLRAEVEAKGFAVAVTGERHSL